MNHPNIQLATYGGGCFWCTEAVFQEVKGVETGGTVPGKPTYREICSGLTGHAEVVQITFDSNIISYNDLLEIFMTTHDPTTLNRQGGDVGTQYRSVIYYHDNHQKEIAEQVIENMSKYFDNPIVTELTAVQKFHEAEEAHQNYFKSNQTQGYCSFVIIPKLAKFRELYARKLKSAYVA